MKIQVLDNAGRVAKVMQTNKSKGRSEISLSTAGLAPGTYVVRVQMGDTIKSIKLLKL